MKDLLTERLVELRRACDRIPTNDPQGKEAEGVRESIMGIMERMWREIGIVLADPMRRGSLGASLPMIRDCIDTIRDSAPVSRARAYALAGLRAICGIAGSYLEYMAEYTLVRQELHHTILLALGRAIENAGSEEAEGRTVPELAQSTGKPEQDIRRALTELIRRELVVQDEQSAAGEGAVEPRYFIDPAGYLEIEADLKQRPDTEPSL